MRARMLALSLTLVVAACGKKTQGGGGQEATGPVPSPAVSTGTRPDPQGHGLVWVQLVAEPGLQWRHTEAWAPVGPKGEFEVQTREGEPVSYGLFRTGGKPVYYEWKWPPALVADAISLSCADHSCGLMWIDNTVRVNGPVGMKVKLGADEFTKTKADSEWMAPTLDYSVLDGRELASLVAPGATNDLQTNPLAVTITKPGEAPLTGQLAVPGYALFQTFLSQFSKPGALPNDTPAPARPRGILANGKIFGHPRSATEIDLLGGTKELAARQVPCPNGYGSDGSFKVTRILQDLQATVTDRRTGALVLEKRLSAPTISCPREIRVGATAADASIYSEVPTKAIDAFFAAQVK